MQIACYVASALGAIAVYLMMPRRGYQPVQIGGLLGAVTLGGVWLYLSRFLPDRLGIPIEGFTYYYVFSGLAIIAATRVITHTKPVFAALWFVMMVLASAGLFLILEAEFVAIALVAIYAGAILVTYLFVIMLATRSGDPPGPHANDDAYDRVSYEPAAATAVGFFLLAVLLSLMFSAVPLDPNPEAAMTDDATIIAEILPNRPASQLLIALPESDAARLEASHLPTDRLDNTERVGLDLLQSHPLGLELAGVLLLVSLIGAVMIAGKHADTASSRDGLDDLDPDPHPTDDSPQGTIAHA